jgi:hypothetical protein
MPKAIRSSGTKRIRLKYYRNMKKAQMVKRKYKVKARKVESLGVKSHKHYSISFSEARRILEEIIEDNLEAFKLLTRY